jgi:cytidyltransferase-like protein
MSKRIVLTTGGFDPIHSGHIEYFKAARQLGDKLVVGLNSDAWLTRKKGRPFMPFAERAAIIKELACVDEVIGFNDDDDTACAAIGYILSTTTDDVVFANGGDRTNTSTPEYATYGNYSSVEFAWSVGGDDKKNSSSWILKNWSQPTTERAWGKYTVLDKKDNWQTKELEFAVNKSLSDQRHFKRSEHWCVVGGEIQIDLEHPNGTKETCILINGESVDIPVNTWHKATNIGIEPAKVIEVWMGADLTEEDIERRD